MTGSERRALGRNLSRSTEAEVSCGGQMRAASWAVLMVCKKDKK